jgi:hypothetical protein
MISIYNVCALQLKQTSAAVAADKKLKLISRVVVVVVVDLVVLVRIEIIEQRARDRLRLF